MKVFFGTSILKENEGNIRLRWSTQEGSHAHDLRKLVITISLISQRKFSEKNEKSIVGDVTLRACAWCDMSRTLRVMSYVAHCALCDITRRKFCAWCDLTRNRVIWHNAHIARDVTCRACATGGGAHKSNDELGLKNEILECFSMNLDDVSWHRSHILF